MNRYNLNEILLSEDYETTKSTIKDKIITDLAGKRVNYSNDYQPVNNNFLKDELIELVVNKEAYEITYGNFLTLLVVARPFNEHKVPFPEDMLFDLSDLHEYGKYYTLLLEMFKFDKETKISIKDIISELAILSGEINVTFGNTVSIKALTDLERNVSRFRELIHYKLPKDEAMEFDKIEKIINHNRDEIMDILSNTDNILKYYTKSGAGVNTKQYGQVLSLIGSKPDLFGNIIPYPINTSFLRGLSVRDFFINALGARKALITNHQQVRNSGYLTRKISMLLMDTKLTTEDDCGSNESNYMKIDIPDKKTLKRYEKRYYLDDNDILKEIDVNDESLIGKTLSIPSPVTCASKHGICKKCYGRLFDINKDLNIGMIAVLILTDPLTQRLLSAKHLLETRSSKLDWGEKFEEFFIVNRNLITPKENNISIIIREDDYIEDDETEDAQVFRVFSVKSGNKQFVIESPVKLYLVDILSEKIDEHYNIEEAQYEISLSSLDDGDNFAHFIMENNELSKPLREIKDLIETNKYIKDHSINEAINYFVHLLNESGINIQSVHIELILREMMKLKNPDREQFKLEKMPKYEMLRITDANLKGESLSRALLFEQIKKQLTTLDYDTFSKTKSSILDKLL